MKRLLQLWTAVLALLFHSAGPLFADGKMYSEKVNTEIPYQRALIGFDEGKEMLVLQSQYQIPGEPGNHKLGWVVPVPAVPEISSMKADEADMLFWNLDRLSHPKVTSMGITAFLGVFVLGSCVSVITFIASFVSRFAHHKCLLRNLAYSAAFIVCLVILIGPMLVRQRKGIAGVEVIKSGKVGIFETKVIRSDSSKDLIAWFNANSFRFDQNDEKTVQSYIDRKWCFVTAKVDASVDTSDRAAVFSKLLAPLIMLFPSPNPVYPTALTATSGQSTEILIYLASKEPFKTDSALECKFRGAVDGGSILSQLLFIESDEFLENAPLETNHLSKFKATLTPARMAKDIEFLPDPGAQPYREHVYRW